MNLVPEFMKLRWRMESKRKRIKRKARESEKRLSNLEKKLSEPIYQFEF